MPHSDLLFTLVKEFVNDNDVSSVLRVSVAAVCEQSVVLRIALDNVIDLCANLERTRTA